MPRSLTPTRDCIAIGPSQPAKLAYLGHVLMENRHALVVDTRLTLATGTAEREAALEMAAARPGNHRITLGADKAYDVAGFVADLRASNVTPHVAQNTKNRRSAIDRRTTRHPGYAVSGRIRKRIEEVFGWTKSAAGFRKTRHRGLACVKRSCSSGRKAERAHAHVDPPRFQPPAWGTP